MNLFQKNIKFFYQNIPSFYKLITSIKTRRYQLVNNNILDTQTNTYLYPNSIDEDSIIFSYNPVQNSLWEKNFFYINPEKLDEKEFYLTGKIVNSLTDKAKNLNYTDGFYFENNFLPATVILGLLSGKHIEILAQKYNFQSLFIYEPEPEFFAISLYFIDYEKLYKKLRGKLFVFIKNKINYFAIEKFYFERIITSNFARFTLTTYENKFIIDAKNKFNKISVLKNRGWGTFEDEIKGIKNHLQNIGRYPLLNKSKKLNIPVCIAANGKSLEKNIEFIKKNKDSMIIISVGTALKPLIKAGLQSDFHIEQERIDTLIEALKDILPNYRGYFLGASVVNQKIFQMAKKPLMYIREAFTQENNYFTLKYSSPIVGNTGMAFASEFSNEIYLCGMDLGFRLGERKHSYGSFYDNKEDTEQKGIKVKGNLSDDIYSDSLFLSSKSNIEKLIKEKQTNVYNLSDGAYIEGSVPIKDKKLPLIDKEKYIREIINCFNKTDYKDEKPDIKNLLLAISKAMDIKIDSKEKLTSLIEGLEDLIKTYEQIDKSGFLLLRGSLFHILNNLYILSYKIDFKNYNKLTKIIKKEIFKFNEILNKIF
ncbi:MULTISPECIES: 6-hydroxymethylpterin diphosphokinase MptE-like protein [unclassified Lebetimonas]|uniref:motility associated factor glycosyltransferase family protein n=1 Tax=unclassified Lebetimonas TaxID=2648158 RepID=UPI0004676D9E|nr:MULTISPECIES: 6-hydroxymethylpterin diphosphokinase MptE-like protein [unclassified Lebetimonas]